VGEGLGPHEHPIRAPTAQGAETKTPSAEAGRDRGDARCYTCPTQARKAKRANAPQAESSKGSQSASTSAQQQTAAKKKNKKAKHECLGQNTPVRVEVVRPTRASFPEESDGLVRSTRF
jgi:uncharacterized membrane protein